MKKILKYIAIALLTIVTLSTSLSINVFAKDKGLTVKVEPECDFKLYIIDGLIPIDQEKLIPGKEYKLHVHKYAESDPYFVVDQMLFEAKDKTVTDISKYDIYSFMYTGNEVVTVRGHMKYPDKVQVTFSFNNGVCISPNMYSNTKDKLTVNVPFGSNLSLSNFNFEMTGYKLTGYSINGENVAVNSTYGPIKDNIVIETKWEENKIPDPEKTYSITFVSNSNLIDSSNFIIKDKSGKEVTNSNKLEPGKYYYETKNFDNENYLVLTYDGFNGSKIVSNPVEITNSDIVIYANILPKVEATFDVDGNKNVVSKIETCKGKSITLPSCNYDIPGFKFTGWKHDGTIYQTGDSFTMNDNCTFEAIYSECSYTKIVTNKDDCVDKNYEIIFKYSDGQIVDVNNVLVGETIYAYCKDNFNSQKYTNFKVESDAYGVMNEVNLNNDSYSFVTSNKNVTFKIHMANKYSFIIHFDANGGRGKMDDIVVNAGKEIDEIECDFIKDGYVFDGWELDGIKVTKIKVTSDMNLKATWKRYVEKQFSNEPNGIKTYQKNSSSKDDLITENSTDVEVSQTTNYYKRTYVDESDEIIEIPSKASKEKVTINDITTSTNVIVEDDNNKLSNTNTNTNTTNTNVVTSIDSTSNYSEMEEVVPTHNIDNNEENKDIFTEILSVFAALFISVTLLVLFIKPDSNHENDIDEKY